MDMKSEARVPDIVTVKDDGPGSERPAPDPRTRSRNLASMLVTCLIIAWLVYQSNVDATSDFLRTSNPAAWRPPQITFPPESTSGLKHAKQAVFRLDVVTDSRSGWVTTGVEIDERLNECAISRNVTGTFNIVRGEYSQPSPFMVGMRASASSQRTLDSVRWSTSSHCEHEPCTGMDVQCVPPDVSFANQEDAEDSAVELDLRLFVKPGTHMGTEAQFTIDLSSLDIIISPDLWFQANVASLSTFAGNVVGHHNEEFVMYWPSVTSGTGSITGTWSFYYQMGFNLNGFGRARADEGVIDVDLIPIKLYPGASAAPGTVGVITGNGDVNIRMPFDEDKLSLRDMRISVNSKGGSIDGTYVIGSETYLTTGGDGSVNATLLPYYGGAQSPVLRTRSERGDTNIEILPAVIDRLWPKEPLNETSSEHQTTSGDLSLIYPHDWQGTAVGLSERGEVSMTGARFKRMTKAEHMATGRTRNRFGSRLGYTTSSGDASLVLLD